MAARAKLVPKRITSLLDGSDVIRTGERSAGPTAAAAADQYRSARTTLLRGLPSGERQAQEDLRPRVGRAGAAAHHAERPFGQYFVAAQAGGFWAAFGDRRRQHAPAQAHRHHLAQHLRVA